MPCIAPCRSSADHARSAQRARHACWRAQALPRHLHAALHPANMRTSDIQSARTRARWRPPLQPPRCPSAPHTHCREPRPLPAPATPRRRAPGAIPARSRAGSSAPVPLPAATTAIDKVAAAAAVAAETWCMHTAQPARDCQGAGYKVLRAQATEDARPTIASAMRCAGRQPPCRPRPPCRSRSRW